MVGDVISYKCRCDYWRSCINIYSVVRENYVMSYLKVYGLIANK